MDSAPVYDLEVRFFRHVLGISYESGRRLRERDVLVPDAFTSDGRALYMITPEAISKAQATIHSYRAKIARTRHNLPSLCLKKVTIV